MSEDEISGRLGVEGHIGEKPYKAKNLKPHTNLEKQADGRILRKAKERGERIWTGKIGSLKHGSAMDAVKQTDGVNDNSQLQTPTPNSQGQELQMSHGCGDLEEASSARGHSQSRDR